MLQLKACPLSGLDEVSEHAKVGLHILGRIPSGAKRTEEQVGHIRSSSESVHEACLVAEIHGQAFHLHSLYGET